MIKERNLTGVVFVAGSALCFALGGLFVKLVPWSAFSIQAVRSVFAMIVMLLYMRIIGHPFRMNRWVVLGGVANAVMSTTFVIANQMTTAANAVVLQFVEPFFVILIMWIVWKKKPDRSTIIASLIALGGILCFFFTDLSPGNMIGNVIAIFSGFALAGVYLIKMFPDGDFESSLVLSYILNFLVGIWWVPRETEFSGKIWLVMVCFGLFQFSLSYILLSRGLDHVTPVTASLMSMIEPVLNPMLVAVFYGEMVGILAIIGAVLVIGSVTFYSVGQARASA